MVKIIQPESQQLQPPPPILKETSVSTTIQTQSQQLRPTQMAVLPVTPLQPLPLLQLVATQSTVSQMSSFSAPITQHQLPTPQTTLSVNQSPIVQPPPWIPLASQSLMSAQPTFTFPPLAQTMVTPRLVFYSATVTWGEPIITTDTCRQPAPVNNPPMPPNHSLQLPFQQHVFYGPNPGYHAFYGLPSTQTHNTRIQYNMQMSLAIPNQDCLSRSVTSRSPGNC